MKTKRLSIRVVETDSRFRAVFLPDTSGIRGVCSITSGTGATPQEAVADLVAKGWDRVKHDRYNPSVKP